MQTFNSAEAAMNVIRIKYPDAKYSVVAAWDIALIVYKNKTDYDNFTPVLAEIKYVLENNKPIGIYHIQYITK